MCQFSGKTSNFDFFRPTLSKMSFWGRNFKNLILDSESAPHVYKYFVKMNSSEFFGLNLGNSPNYVRHFGSNSMEGVAESWAEAEMRWMELGGGGCTV